MTMIYDTHMIFFVFLVRFSCFEFMKNMRLSKYFVYNLSFKTDQCINIPDLV